MIEPVKCSVTFAYLAGIIDGDGYISITRSVRKGKIYFGPQIGIAGTRREPHDLAAELWGGIVSKFNPTNPRHRPQFQWSRMGAAAMQVIDDIFPYLVIKQDHAVLAGELFTLVQYGKSDDPFPWMSPEYDPLPEYESLRSEMIELNQSRNRIGKKLSGRQLDGREWNEVPTCQ